MKKNRTRCPECGHLQTYSPMVVRRTVTKEIQCSNCGHSFRPVPQRIPGNDARKRSNDQEKRTARRHEAKIQPGSGSLSGAKADVRKEGERRIECKHTTKASISLKQDWLRKICGEASAGEIPLLEIEFQGTHPYERYVVVRAEDFEALLDGED